ncbi:hypothetical protein [Iodidimonas sp. SYSU 1G8]|uniref:COG3904 family protein n=1 Tax=Iodidimonas sp. SYSU 1G8 TaxID=3133967 RepID=UPI0031FE9BF8
MIAVALVFSALFDDYQPVWSFIALSFFWSFILAVATWQIVGVWRSAGHHVSRGGQKFWAIVARLMVLVGLVQVGNVVVTNMLPQLAESFRILTGDTKLGNFHIRLLNNGTELEFAGSIKFGATEQLRQAMDGNPVKVIHLNSNGGRIAEAVRMRDFIRSKKLVTITTSRCLSACTIAFLGGRERYVPSTGQRLGFHQGKFPGVDQQDMRFTMQSVIDDAVAHGVDRAFMEEGYATAHSSMWYPTTEEAIAAGYVTGASSGQFAVSGTGGASSEAIREQLRTVLLARNIEKVDPKAFHILADHYAESLAQGIPEEQALINLRMTFGMLLRKYLPHTSEAALLEITKVTLRQIEAVQAQDPEACGHFLFPDGTRLIDLNDYVDEELIAREARAFDLVFDTLPATALTLPSEEEAQPAVTLLLENIRDKYGEDAVTMLGSIETAPRDQVCPVMQAMYSEALALPMTQRIQVLRLIYSGG